MQQESAKDAAKRSLLQRHGKARWEYLLKDAEQGRHPSVKYVKDMLATYGAPTPEAGAYAVSRLAVDKSPAPRGRPHKPTLPPNHFDPADVREELFRIAAITAVQRRHARYKKLRLKQRPRRPYTGDLKNRPRLKFVGSRGIWRVSEPKEEARRVVGRRWSVGPSTLKEWENRLFPGQTDEARRNDLPLNLYWRFGCRARSAASR